MAYEREETEAPRERSPAHSTAQHSIAWGAMAAARRRHCTCRHSSHLPQRSEPCRTADGAAPLPQWLQDCASASLATAVDKGTSRSLSSISSWQPCEGTQQHGSGTIVLKAAVVRSASQAPSRSIDPCQVRGRCPGSIARHLGGVVPGGALHVCKPVFAAGRRPG